jgi:hypothetical protein
MYSRGPLTARLLILLDAPDEELEAASAWHFKRALLNEDDMVRWEYAAGNLASVAHEGGSALVECRTILTTGSESLRCVTGIGADSFHHKKSGGLSRLVGSVWSREEVVAIRAACQPQLEPLCLPPKLHSVVAALHPANALRGSLHLMPTVYQMIRRARNLSLEESF